MSCEKKSECECHTEVKALQVEELKVSAQALGLDEAGVADILEKWGSDVLAVCVEAARSGFSPVWVMNTLTRFGPTVLEFFTDLWNHNGMVAAASVEQGVVLGDLKVTPENLEMFDGALIQKLAEKFLPMLMDKYGERILELIVEAILNSLKK